MTSPRQNDSDAALPGTDLAMAALIIPGALAVTGGIAGMSVARVTLEGSAEEACVREALAGNPRH